MVRVLTLLVLYNDWFLREACHSYGVSANCRSFHVDMLRMLQLSQHQTGNLGTGEFLMLLLKHIFVLWNYPFFSEKPIFDQEISWRTYTTTRCPVSKETNLVWLTLHMDENEDINKPTIWTSKMSGDDARHLKLKRRTVDIISAIE
jgi:hypothetical protein